MSNRSLLLLVEDNPDDAELTLMAFEQGGITNPVIIAQDGAEALDYLIPTDSTAIDLPALVLLDLQLPKINGLQVLRAIRNHASTKLLPVVILTTSDEQADLINSYNLGCNSYVRKPVDYDQFLTVIQQLGMYWLVTNLSPPLLPLGNQNV